MKYQISYKQAKQTKQNPNKNLCYYVLLGVLAVAFSCIFIQIDGLSKDSKHNFFFPNYSHKEAFCATITAYNAEIEQTDNEPLIMASGKRVYDGAIACPIRFNFGDKVEIQGKIYTCEDRMALRFRSGNYFDIYLESKEEALKFGRKLEIVKVI